MVACAEEARPLDEPGDPCRSAGHICVGDDMALVCEDKVWELASCEEICAERGPAWIPNGCELELHCECVLADPDGCTPGEAMCADESIVRTCSEAQEWEDAACDVLCAAEGLNSAGCRMGMGMDDEPWMTLDACWCTSEGTSCSGEEPICIDAQTLASCEADVWVFEDCAESCGGAAGVCDPFADTDVCVCEM